MGRGVGVTDEGTQGRKGRPTLLLQGLSLLKSCVGCESGGEGINV
jgi:hypothetical protein